MVDHWPNDSIFFLLFCKLKRPSSFILYPSSRTSTQKFTENHSQPKYRVEETSPEGYIYKTFPHLQFRDQCGRGAGKTVRSGGSESLLGDLSPSNIRTTPTKSHQHDCLNDLNKNVTNRIAKVDMGLRGGGGGEANLTDRSVPA